MASTVATMAVLNPKSLPLINNKLSSPQLKSASALPPKLLSLQTARIHLSVESALAGAMFATIAASKPALMVQQIAEGDSRGLALLLSIVPAVVWVLYNIFQHVLNQINQMRKIKGIAVGLGLGGIGALAGAERACAAVSEVVGAIAADAAPSDSRGQMLLVVVTPALLWVAYNILRPALNQIDQMRSD